MADNFQSYATDLAGPYADGAVVTPSDSADLTNVAASLWIGTAGSGTLRVTTIRGTTLDFAGVGVGLFPVRVRRVHSTGTGVSNIVAFTA